jgi:hypothetical protein
MSIIQVVVSKSKMLESFRNEANDIERGTAMRLSRQYGCWYLATLDGVKWETRAHMPSEFIQCITFIDGKWSELTELQTVEPKIEKAVKWLQNHFVTILGTTPTGVCAIEECSRDGVGYGQSVWLPANINVLRDWMNY